MSASPEGATLRGGDEELRKRLLWITAIRIAAVTVLVGTTATLVFKGNEPLGGTPAVSLSVLAAATNLLQIVVAILLRRGRALRFLAALQVVGDVAFAAALVYLTGGSDSLFTFLFLIAIVTGGILLSRPGAWGAAALSFAADVAVVVGLQRGFIPPIDKALQPSRLAWDALAQTLFTHGSAFALTAMLAAYAAAQISTAGRRAAVAESSLQRLHALHDAIVRSISSGIATADDRGRITYLNRAGEEILGQSAAALLGMEMTRVFPTLTGAVEGEGGKAARLESVWTTSTGDMRQLGFTVTPLVDDGGRRIGSTAVFQDLSPYRELQRRAARSERLAAVGQLAAGLAHELRNPLASMSGSVELLAAQLEDPAAQRLFGIVLRESDRLNRLVTDFLGFAGTAPTNLGAVELASVAGEVLTLVGADPAAAGFARTAELEPASALADEGQVRQVVWNLVRNAVEASSSDGEIRVTTGTRKGQAFVRVEDRGAGIHPELLERIFDPFFTTKDRGTGLGLATVHRIVDGLGGHLEVDSVVGEGTRFTVVLPAFPQQVG
ncbi:Two-component sensor PilS [Vulgatibacter incomptus]|uniref:histidine kinase n=1 Tax=Vulgatibacter incomptus TaxID=1391653 RepID=A0A0K1PA63_9BACT|nr:Two-component sensor PilS [Vulgatibacter incomptus]